MGVDFAVPDTGAADAGAVLGDDERGDVDLERGEAGVPAPLVQLVGAALCLRLGRDDQRVDVVARGRRPLRVLETDDLERCGVGRAELGELPVEVVTALLERPELFDVSGVVAGLGGEVGVGEPDDDVSLAGPVVGGRCESG